MTGRQRLQTMFAGKPTDRLSGTTLVDSNVLQALPGAMQGMSELDFYRHLDCDILLLNGWTTGIPFDSPALVTDAGFAMSWKSVGDEHQSIIACPGGHILTATWTGSHPTKYLVETLDDLRRYREFWEASRYEPRDDGASHVRLTEMIGDDGLYVRFWGPSTIPKLLENDMGTVQFYYMLNDYPAEVEALIEVIHRKELAAFEALADGPCDTITLCENTSTYYISPDIYRRFNGPHVKDFVDIVKKRGKTALLHMCGHVRDLLPDIKKTGADGVHALTPPSTGNTPWELYLDVVGEDQIIIGCLDPSIFEMLPLQQVGQALDKLITPRLRKSRFVLACFADGHRVPHERFMAVKRWIDENGIV